MKEVLAKAVADSQALPSVAAPGPYKAINLPAAEAADTCPPVYLLP